MIGMQIKRKKQTKDIRTNTCFCHWKKEEKEKTEKDWPMEVELDRREEEMVVVLNKIP